MRSFARRWVWGWLALAVVVSAGPTAVAEVEVARVFADHMVLQRGQAAPVWGWADPGERVTVRFADQTHEAVAGDDGAWRVTLSPMEASAQPRELVVAGENTLTIADVLVGEVWIASGQSNMWWRLDRTDEAEAARARAKDNAARGLIREFNVKGATAAHPQDRLSAKDGWTAASHKSIKRFSAVGYYFAESLQDGLDGVPVGLLNATWPGTKIEPWISMAALEAQPTLSEIAGQVRDAHELYKTQKAAAEESAEAPKHPLVEDHQNPTVIYNAMIAPLAPYAARGVIWYQGESNRGDGLLYADKLAALIAGWRQAWDAPELPFGLAQLAPHGDNMQLPMMWQAQDLAAQRDAHVGLAMNTDAGSLKNIHPSRKQPLGHRLALWALANVYGQENLVWAGPRFESVAVDGGAVRLRFEHVADGLESRGGEALTHFQVAGADRQFHEAVATIEGADTVVVQSDAVAKPVAVRFGWHSAAEPNLVNSAGIPALPFRTDTWEAGE